MLVRCDGKILSCKVYRGEDACKHFVNTIILGEKTINETFKNPKDIIMTIDAEKNYKESTNVGFAKNDFF